MEREPSINIVLVAVPGGELRLVGNLLPHVAARLEHHRFCDWCSGNPLLSRGPKPRDHRYCEACHGEGYAEYDEEGCNCLACIRFWHVVQPGNDMDLRGMGEQLLADRNAKLLEAA